MYRQASPRRQARRIQAALNAHETVKDLVGETPSRLQHSVLDCWPHRFGSKILQKIRSHLSDRKLGRDLRLNMGGSGSTHAKNNSGSACSPTGAQTLCLVPYVASRALSAHYRHERSKASHRQRRGTQDVLTAGRCRSERMPRRCWTNSRSSRFDSGARRSIKWRGGSAVHLGALPLEL
jgi:hypothetical protein